MLQALTCDDNGVGMTVVEKKEKKGCQSLSQLKVRKKKNVTYYLNIYDRL